MKPETITNCYYCNSVPEVKLNRLFEMDGFEEREISIGCINGECTAKPKIRLSFNISNVYINADDRLINMWNSYNHD